MTYLAKAYLAAGMVGAVAPIAGSYIIQRRLALIGDGLGHLAFGGAALAAAASMSPLPVSFAVAIAGAAAIELLQRRARARADVALAVVFYFGIAAGVVLLSTSHTLSGSALSILFGSLLTVSTSDVQLIAAVMAVSAVILIGLKRSFFLLVLDEETSQVAGMRVGAVATLLSILAAVVVVAGMRAVGVLLVAALLVLPAATGQRIGNSFASSLTVSSAAGIACALGGVLLAVRLDWPPGATIVLVSIALYLVSLPVGAVLARQR